MKISIQGKASRGYCNNKIRGQRGIGSQPSHIPIRDTLKSFLSEVFSTTIYSCDVAGIYH